MENETGKQAFPKDFRPQRIGIEAVKAISDLPPPAIAEHFRKNPDLADRLMSESCDKRFTPSSFIVQEGERFRVGWYSRPLGYECVQEFATLADAATDYLLLSLGKGRWNPPQNTPEN